MQRPHDRPSPETLNCHRANSGRLTVWLATMLAAFTLTATSAFAERFGDWEVERSRGLIIASTISSGNSVFGYSCSRSPNECVFFFMPDSLKCTDGGRYALLMNGGRESTGRSSTCRQLPWAADQQYANVLDGTDSLRKQLLNADETTMGIARGTGADNFATSKFSMRGFRGAYERVNRYRDRSEYSNDDRREERRDDRRDAVPDDRPPAVELYEHDDFMGRRLNVRGDVADLEDHNFNDKTSSLVVNRGRWELCTDARFRGRCRVYGPGRYPNVRGYNDEFSSIRKVE